MFNTKNLYSLYIHWPFCRNKCYYCDFVAMEQHSDFQLTYHAALIKEIEQFAQQMPIENQNISTIFIGGGTPSLYPLNLMEELSKTLKKYFNFENIKEISIETNPTDITEEKLDAWAEFGITRLSMGVQVLDDNVLFKLNRRQRTSDVFNAVKIIPKYFDNFSIDLILGLPGVSNEVWNTTIEQAISWKPKHISVYFLMLHEKTPLYFKVKRKELFLSDDNQIIENYFRTVQTLEDNGFEQYEISNFSKPGFNSIHNKAYWNRKIYKGFGLGACSFDGQKRYINEKNLEKYTKTLLTNGNNPLSLEERISPQQEKIETLMLALRQKRGGDLHRMVYLLNEQEKNKFYTNIKHLKAASLVEERDGRLMLTLRGMILENEVLLKLI